jgi:hypothetical protein
MRLHVLFLSLPLALVACTPTAPSTNIDGSSSTAMSSSSMGQFCGGIAALPCPEGFACVLDGTYPDAGGTCVQTRASSASAATR